MGGDGRDCDSARGISSQDCKTDCGNGCEEGLLRGMGVVLGGHGIGSNRELANKGVREESASNNSVLCSREGNIKNMYRCR